MYGKRISNRELGKLLKNIGESLSSDQNITIMDLIKYMNDIGVNINFNSMSKTEEQYNLNFIFDFIKRFKNNRDLREFLIIFYKMKIPYRISKENLEKISIGVFMTSNVDMLDSYNKWIERANILDHIDVYNVNEDKLLEKLMDPFLFPDGYSIIDFIKKFRIKLRTTSNKNDIILELYNHIYKRPMDIRKIGYWGINVNRGDRYRD